MRILLMVLALAALGACGKKAEQPANQSVPTAEAGPVAGLDRSHHGKPAPDAAFKDAAGKDVSLAAFRGTPVLLNLWATWCVPCVKELPTLDRLAQSQKDGKLTIVAVSQDNGPHASVVAFLGEHKIGDLGAYQDSAMALSGGFGAEVLPTSVLIGADGREIWRYVGDRDWTDAGSAKLLSEAAAPGAH